MLIEAAAEEDSGVAIAEAECIYNGWGGGEEDKEEAFKGFTELAEGDGGARPGDAGSAGRTVCTYT